MRATRIATVVASIALLSASAGADERLPDRKPPLIGDSAEAPPPAPTLASASTLVTASVTPPARTEPEMASLLVTIRHMNGETETFSRDLDSLELIFDATGKLSALHLITITNGEKDTHRYFFVSSLAAFSYRFLNLAGKGKVRLKALQPFTVENKEAPQGVPATIPKDYR